MKKIICLLFMFFIIFSSFAKESNYFFKFLISDINTVDRKNFIYEYGNIQTDYKGDIGNGKSTIEQYYVNSDLIIKGKTFSFKTILVENEKATSDNYVVSTDNDLMNKPVKIFKKDDFEKILSLVKNEKDKKYLLSFYNLDNDFYKIFFKKGLVKKEEIKKIRSILESINYEYKYKLVWDVTYDNMRITGSMPYTGNWDLKINDKLFVGKITLFDVIGKLGDKTVKMDFSINSIVPYVLFDKDRFNIKTGDLKLKKKGFAEITQISNSFIGYEPTDEEFFFVISYMFGFSVTSRY